MRKKGLLVAFVMVGASSLAVFGPAIAASATPLCYGAWESNLVTGTTHVGPECIPYGNATLCQAPSAGVGVLAAVGAEVCVPQP